LLPALTFQLEENITLELDLAPSPGDIWCDPADLERTLMALTSNAREAMAQGGRLTLRTAQAGPGDDRIMLSVEDTGHGMNEELQSRLFEPFFTTKTAGRGAGLGLSAVYGMVKLAGGDIRVDSKPGEGSAFRLLFPRYQENHRPGPDAPAPDGSGAGGETVLLVEDDEEVRFLLQSILKSDGYNVLEARDGERALEVAQAHRGPIHLILTDLHMPRMGGRRLAETLVPRHPGMKVMFMSGFTEEDFPVREGWEIPVSFLQKPFMPKSMLRQVRRVFDG
jgi:CheY-like chemotaxis protein